MEQVLYRAKEATPIPGLLLKAIDYLKINGYSYLLVKPATVGLFELYQKLGFEKELHKSSYKQYFEQIDKASISWRYQKIIGSVKQLSPERLAKLREDQLSKSCFMWPLSILRYALSEVLDRNGNAFEFEKITIEGLTKRIYVIGYRMKRISPERSSKSLKATHLLRTIFKIFIQY